MSYYFRRSILAALAVFLGVISMANSAAALTVKDVRIGLHPDKTRLVVELDEMSKFRTFVLAEPWRLVIDFSSFDWQVGAISKPKQSAVKSIRQGQLQPGISRIVVDLKSPVSIGTAFLLKKHEGRPDRLVIDFSKTTPETYLQNKGKVFGILEVNDTGGAITKNTKPKQNKSIARKQTSMAGSNVTVPRKKPASQTLTKPAPSRAVKTKKSLIVIDPGHGGVDPGAIGANGVFEKHVALAMAKELKKLLEATGQYKVKLTRERDIYKRLYKRVDFARTHDADLFISLHADTIGKSNVSGASIYTLSEKASDVQTEKLADRENKADIIAGTDLSHEDKQVAGILIDLAMRDTMNQSNFFANTIVDSMKNGNIKILEKPHRSAGFAVLKAPDIPSVLIEVGFMSNKREAQMLSRPEYRQKIARTIVSGVNAYFKKVQHNNRI